MMTTPELLIPRPSAKQFRFMTETAKYICFGGARGGGKSWAVRVLAVMLSYQYAGIVCCIIRKTYPELRENHIKQLRQMLRCGQSDALARYNDSEKKISFPNGSTILFRYLETESDEGRFQGTEVDVLFLDEATQHPEQRWDILKACVRGVNDFPKRIYLTCNPGGVGHGWVKRLFIDRQFKPDEKPEEYVFIQSLVTDNKALMREQPDYLDQLRSLPPKQREAWLYGNWEIFEGQFFEDFRAVPDLVEAEKHGCKLTADELRQAHRWCHVIPPIDLSRGEPRHWTIYRSYDFGYGKPFSCAWWAVDYDGVFYRIMELYGCTDTPNEGLRWTPDQQFKRIAEIEKEHPWLRGKKIEGVADPAIWDASRGESIADTAMRYGVYFVPGDHERIPGWMQCHYRLQFDDDGYARMYVFDNCKGFIRTIPLMMFDDHHPEDLDTDLEDHIADEWRYMCMTQPVKPIKAVPKRQILSDPLNQYTK
ncbi:MAG: phage terminase large subunit [Oscillospiraceae bacterium]|nr:phage terminase large subunit [Oscillospiraceae bacterium]